MPACLREPFRLRRVAARGRRHGQVDGPADHVDAVSAQHSHDARLLEIHHRDRTHGVGHHPGERGGHGVEHDHRACDVHQGGQPGEHQDRRHRPGRNDRQRDARHDQQQRNVHAVGVADARDGLPGHRERRVERRTRLDALHLRLRHGRRGEHFPSLPNAHVVHYIPDSIDGRGEVPLHEGVHDHRNQVLPSGQLDEHVHGHTLVVQRHEAGHGQRVADVGHCRLADSRIAANTTYVASVRALTAQYSLTASAFITSYTNATLSVPASGGVTSSADVFPAFSSTTNYFVDVVAAP